ncbi:MAG: hypothetical protein K2W82_13970 [Candidatus Obscuribacterales bacterium]|nr:hypothetical protein [Candidatus Obscuribacterales bacterium]
MLTVLLWLIVSALVVSAVLLWRRTLWQQAEADISLADELIQAAERFVLLRNDYREYLRKSKIELQIARQYFAGERQGKLNRYKCLRHTLDNSLWWAGQCLIANEPDYLLDKLGENRALAGQLFNRWDLSMPWQGAYYDRDKKRARLARLKAYREARPRALVAA